jgi:hypothetical protein
MTVHRALVFAVVVSACLVAPASGQRGPKPLPPPRQQEVSPPNRAVLLQEINRRFMNQARIRLGLTPAQLPRFQRIVSGYAQVRSGLEVQEHRTEAAMREQLRLGAAGNQDSLSHLLAGLNATRASIAGTFADESRDLEPVLNPTQRAQWQVMRDRFAQQVRAAMLQRPAGGPDPEP